MSLCQQFSAKDPAEVIVYGISFTNLLGVGETISTATFSKAVASGIGSDSGAGALTLSGAADISAAPIVKQTVSGGISGLTYRLTATVTTNAGRTLVASALLPVASGAC